MTTQTNTTAKKVDVRAIMQKAQNKTNEVNKGTAKIEATLDTYKVIPGFKQYEINSKNVVRNAKTKMAQTLKKGTGKFYLLNDAGQRKLISLADIRVSLPMENTKENKPAKTQKVKAEKAPKVQKLPVGINELPEVTRHKVEKILALEQPRFVKTYKLDKLSLETQVIADLLGEVKFNVLRDLRQIRNGKKVVPENMA
jgi:hypothetical protein